MTRSPMQLSASALVTSMVLLGLAACAGDRGSADADDGPGGPAAIHGPPGAGRRPPNVFISPAGQPFHARRDDPYPVATWFAAADSDHDGRLTRDEFRADSMAFFRQLDTNHDGVIDGLEVQAYEQTIAPEILPRLENLHAGEGMDQSLDYGDPHNRNRSQGGGRPSGLPREGPTRSANTEITQGAALFSLINEPEPVAAADTQFDGRITQAEFLAAADRRFDLLDTKKQGYLTLAGLPKTPVQTAIEKARRADLRSRGGSGRRPPDGSLLDGVSPDHGEPADR